MTLGSKVINLIGLHFLQDACQVRAIGKVTIVQLETYIISMRIFENMIDTLRIERGGAAFNTMDLIALFKQEFSQI